MKSYALVALLGLASTAMAAKLAVVTIATPAYPQEKRRVYEKPMFQLGKGEVVELVKTAAPLSQIRTKSGRIGWIETSRLDTVNRPPMLSLLPPDTTKAPAPTPKEDSLLLKKWIETQRAGEKDSIQ
jgi:hypothetical protein